MKKIKLIVFFILGVSFALSFFAWKQMRASTKISYLQASQDNYYKNPPRTKIDTNQINIICPLVHEKIGERYMVEDLEKFFTSQGKIVHILDEAEYYQKQNFERAGASINIFIYGWVPFWPNKNGINIIYLLFPEIPSLAYHFFDLVAVASPKYLDVLAKKGVSAVYIPQFTNPSRFKYEPNEKLKSSLLFVGNAYHIFRAAVKYAVVNNFEIDVYGKGWEEFLPKKMIKGQYISNDDLHRYYASADIVLNVHREDMAQNGFVSNRIFDASASGGFLVSDYMPEIKDVYGDNIPMYHDSEDYGRIVRYYLSHPEERKQRAQKAREITMQNYTVEKIGQMFLDEIDKIAKKRKAQGTIIFEK